METNSNFTIIDEQLRYLADTSLLDVVKQRMLTENLTNDYKHLHCKSVVDCFIWSITPEGHDYWLTIQDNLFKHTPSLRNENIQFVVTYVFPLDKYPELHI